MVGIIGEQRGGGGASAATRHATGAEDRREFANFDVQNGKKEPLRENIDAPRKKKKSWGLRNNHLTQEKEIRKKKENGRKHLQREKSLPNGFFWHETEKKNGSGGLDEYSLNRRGDKKERKVGVFGGKAGDNVIKKNCRKED